MILVCQPPIALYSAYFGLIHGNWKKTEVLEKVLEKRAATSRTNCRQRRRYPSSRAKKRKYRTTHDRSIAMGNAAQPPRRTRPRAAKRSNPAASSCGVSPAVPRSKSPPAPIFNTGELARTAGDPEVFGAGDVARSTIPTSMADTARHRAGAATVSSIRGRAILANDGDD